MVEPIQMTNEQFQTLLGQLGAAHRVDSPDVQKPEKPLLDVEMSEGDWSLFLDSWARFKRMARITAVASLRDNLRQCCSQQMNKRLFDMKGKNSLDAATEEQLLQWIKGVAVKTLHTEVHRTKFVNLSQKQGEAIQMFTARLKAEASLCDFHVNAPGTCGNGQCECANHGVAVSFEDDMIATQLVSGAYNKEHQAKVLSESNTLVTLSDKLNRMVALEQSESSLLSLNAGTVSVDEITVNKRKKFLSTGRFSQKQSLHKNNFSNNFACPECKKKHPSCKACGGQHKCTTRCNSCKELGHIHRCCPRSSQAALIAADDSHAQVDDDDDVVFSYTVSVNSALDGGMERSDEPAYSLSVESDSIHHMEWEHDKFQQRAPQAPPVIEVSCQLMHDIHKKHGKCLTSAVQKKLPDSVKCGALADTGAQICTAGMNLLSSLGVHINYLIPTSMNVKGVNHSSMTILGTIILKISAGGKYTKQVVYIASEARRLILSEKSLRVLGVIPDTFPSPNQFPVSSNMVRAAKPCAGQAIQCKCLPRTVIPKLPAAIPFKPVEANLQKLEKWILERYASTAFNTCEHQPIPQMTGPDMVIQINTTTPVAIHSPIPVPHHWKAQVKEGLDADCKLGVIEPVPAGTPTTWCSRMVVTAKSDGSPRRVVDLQKVNAASARETHPTQSPWNQVCTVPPKMRKTVLDAWNGFHSIPLSKESRDKTTFITEWGRYRYLRAPQGFTASGDAYTKRFDDFTSYVPHKTRCIDDTLLYESNIEESFWATLRYIDLCVRNGVIFNPKKFKFARDEIDFAGFTITESAIKPTADMLKAISEFPTPTNLTGARSWFGLVNQVAYAFAQSNIMAPFRDLLKKHQKFYWDSTLEELFQKSKRDIIERIIKGVQMYENGRPTCLATDWSKIGVGYSLTQKHCQCPTENGPNCGPGHWKIVLAGSRFCKDAETRYSPIEGECLAVTYGLEQTRMFVLGCPNLVLAVDHKPLVPILNDKGLDQIKNPRLLNFKEKTLMYNFEAKHVPGFLHSAPDATSRSPVGDTSEKVKVCFLSAIRLEYDADDNCLHETMVASIVASIESFNGAITWVQVVEETRKDALCISLCKAIEEGFPEKKENAAECLRKFYHLKEELYTIEGVPFLGNRMFIPQALRRRVLEILHSANQGVSGMKEAARHRFWWTGMDKDIEQKRSQCHTCNNMSPSNIKEPMSAPREPEYPWQYVVMDYFDLSGVHYLAIADRYTGWPEIHRMNGKVMTLIKVVRNMIAQYGVPDEIASDGGPPFNSYEWTQFLKQWGIHHRESSANYPQSNGRAEAAVKTCKRILVDNTGSDGGLNTDSVVKALLQYRNTPIVGLGMSPSYMLYGRQMKDALPSKPYCWNSETMSYKQKYCGPISSVWQNIKNCREIVAAKRLSKSVEFYDQHKRPLTSLSVGDYVAIQNRRGPNPLRWDRTGQIVERLANRQYLVKSDGSGRVLLRTRTHLKKISKLYGDISTRIDAVPKVLPDVTDSTPLLIPGRLQNGLEVIHPIDVQPHGDSVNDGGTKDVVERSMPAVTVEPIQQDNNGNVPNGNSSEGIGDGKMSAEGVKELRRSTRLRKPRRILSPVMHGQHHDELTQT